MKNASVSIAKAIAIILMVMAHAGCPIWFQHYISMFHMPLFFFMSGYCFKESYLANSKQFVIKRIKGIYIPFVKYGLIFLLFHNVFYMLNIYSGEYGFNGSVSHLYDLREYVKKAVSVICMRRSEQLLGGYWFLHTLFFGSLIFFILKKLLNKFEYIAGGVSLLFAVLLLLFTIKIPMIGYKEFMAAFFIWAGFMYKKNSLHLEQKWMIILLSLALVAIGTCYWQTSMLGCSWKQVVPYSITAIVGTLAVFGLSHYLGASKSIKSVLLFIGDHTLEILTWHFLCFKVISIAIIYIYQLPIVRLSEFPVIGEYASKGYWVLYLLVGVLLPLLFVWIRTRFQSMLCKRCNT